jgi:alanine racemase
MQELRPAWFDVDVDAAVENLRTVRRLVGPARKIFAVVKADAYGFGSVELGRVFAEHGADALGVADLGEGVRLRRAGLKLPILVYPNALPEAAGAVIDADLTPVLTELETAQAYDRAVGASDRLDVFVKVDVGLQRLGVPAAAAVDLVRAIRRLSRLRLAGLCTHLHVLTDAEPAYVEWQFGRFTAVLDAVARDGVEIPVRLAASTLPILGFPGTYLNAVDPGRMLYGYRRHDVKSPLPLCPVFRSLRSRLIEVKEVTPRERFASLAPFPVTRPVRMGIIPMGIADGLHRLNAGQALVRGQRVPILARPSLEHTRLDLTAVPDAALGDEVVLIGRQRGAEITLDDVAERQAVDPQFLALEVGPRVPRVYLTGDRVHPRDAVVDAGSVPRS